MQISISLLRQSTDKNPARAFTRSGIFDKKRADLVPTKSALKIFDYPKSDGGLSLEREAVRALNNGRICLVSADLDFVERAVFLAAAVVLAVVDCAADVLVCKFSSHDNIPFSKEQITATFGLHRQPQL